MEQTLQKEASAKPEARAKPATNGNDAISIAPEQIEHLTLEQIIAKAQVRKLFAEDPLEGMIASIKAVGQLQPIRVRREGERFIIVDGERRYRAFQAMNRPTIAAIIEAQALSEGDIVQRQLIANCQREDLSASEKGTAILQLMAATGWNASQVAVKLGMSSAMATRFMAILTLPDDIQKLIASGDIAASAGYELSRIDDKALQNDLAAKLASRCLTRDALSGIVKARSKPASGGTSGATGRVTAPLGGGRAVTIVGDALSLEGAINILEELLVKLRKARPQGVSLGTFVQMLKDNSQAS